MSKTPQHGETAELPDSPLKALLPTAVYDTLKWANLVVLPAIGTAYTGLSALWHWPLASEVNGTLFVLMTLFGVILGVSKVHYNKNDLGIDGRMRLGENALLELKEAPESGQIVTLKVK